MWRSKKVWSWALYDWANSVFATVVIAGFFPIVFKQYYAADLSATESTFWLGSANSLSSLLVALLAPFMGAMADAGGARKKMLLIFMLIGVVASFFLYPFLTHHWFYILLFYVLASFGFMAANVFYDALIINLGSAHNINQISGLGYGLGYLGGGLLLTACVWMSQNSAELGFSQTMDAVLLSFVFVSIWWLVFSIPMALWVDEYQSTKKIEKLKIIKNTVGTFKKVINNKNIAIFLLAYWLYIDGIDTIIRMAVDYGLSIGFESSDLILALLITQFVGFPAAILYSYLGQKIGNKNAILLGLIVYAIICLIAYGMQSADMFYLLAVLIGLVQGGIQALSRSYYATLIPANQAAEYFGIYNMMGKSAAIVGPLLMGAVAWLSGDHRISILAILPLFIVGGILLLKVKSPKV